MKKTIFLTVTIFSLIWGFPLSAKARRFDKNTDLVKVDLRVGETMRYDVMALGIVGLSAFLQVTDKGYNEKINKFFGRKRLVYRAKMIIQTRGIFQKIYPMNDRLTTYFDAETFLPILCYKNLNEDKFKNTVQIIYDHQKRLAYYSDKWKDRRNIKVGIFDDTLDVVTIVYYLRRVKPLPGTRVRARVEEWPSGESTRRR